MKGMRGKWSHKRDGSGSWLLLVVEQLVVLARGSEPSEKAEGHVLNLCAAHVEVMQLQRPVAQHVVLAVLPSGGGVTMKRVRAGRRKRRGKGEKGGGSMDKRH